MSAVKFSDPVTFSVQMVADDLSVHVDIIPWAKASSRARTSSGAYAVVGCPHEPTFGFRTTPLRAPRPPQDVGSGSELPTEEGQTLRQRCDTARQCMPFAA
jgi:hypothetical protein